MPKLDDLKKIKQLDKSSLVTSVDSLGQQIGHAWKDVQQIDIPKNYRQIKNILICGMGGSSLGGHVIRSLFEEQLEVPIFLRRDYYLPNWADKQTLVVISSYSGNTEETISCAKDALAKNLKTLAITSNGKLFQLAQEKDFPCYKINPQYNVCGEPRMAIGYSVFGQVAMFAKADLIDIQDQEIKKLQDKLNQLTKKYQLKTPVKNNLAKQTAQRLQGKIINYVSAQHLRGAAHVLNNQTNENAKNFSNYFFIPELNHHLMEGLANPQLNKNSLIFLFLNSENYSSRIRKRFNLTQEVVNKNKIASVTRDFTEQNKLQEVFHLILLGGYVTFYLSMLNDRNPAPIPWVDYFKKKLEN